MLLGVRQGKKTLKVHTVSLSYIMGKVNFSIISQKSQDGAVDVRSCGGPAVFRRGLCVFFRCIGQLTTGQNLFTGEVWPS